MTCNLQGKDAVVSLWQLVSNMNHFRFVFQTVTSHINFFCWGVSWLWLRLCLIESEKLILSQVPHSSFLLLQDVQAEILRCWESHSSVQGSKVFLFAFVLTKTLQFDRAVTYLCEHWNEHWIYYAIHLTLLTLNAEHSEISEKWTLSTKRRNLNLVWNTEPKLGNLTYFYMIEGMSKNRLGNEKAVQKT